MVNSILTSAGSSWENLWSWWTRTYEVGLWWG